MATPTPTKSMSSRLLTMKFMQRAVASPSSPSSATSTPDDQASKRRKVSHNPAKRDNTDSLVHIDQSAVQAAIAVEERKRQEAVVQNAAKLGDAHWVLDMPEKTANSNRGIQTPLNVVQVGFAQIDSHIDTSDAAGFDDFEPTDASHIRTPMVRRYNMDSKKVSFVSLLYRVLSVYHFPYSRNLPTYRYRRIASLKVTILVLGRTLTTLRKIMDEADILMAKSQRDGRDHLVRS